MDEVTTMPADDVPGLQAVVQRKLGRCLLRLQQYEQLLKVIVARVELSGPVDRLHTIREQKIACAEDGYLEESYQTINRHCLNLQCWAKTMVEAGAKLASFIQSQTFDDVLNGIRVDGSVDWPGSGICSCLREAEAKLAEDGWTRLEAAIRWIDDTYPEQRFKRYGCSSWRHVLHESRQFEIRKSHAGNERTTVWYRSKVS